MEDDFDDWPDDNPDDNLPRDPEELFSLVRELTADILEYEWMWLIGGNASGSEYRATMVRHRAYTTLDREKGDEAVEAGRRRFAEGFTNEDTRQIFLHGTSRQWGQVVAEAKRAHEDWLDQRCSKQLPTVFLEVPTRRMSTLYPAANLTNDQVS